MIGSPVAGGRTLLVYAQDNQGLGHVTRTLTIARHVLAAFPDTVAYITTKSPIGSQFTLPDRCDYIKLPTLMTGQTQRRTPADEEAAKRQFRRIRSDILVEAALGLAPDLVLVDHEPLGSKGEFREGLWALKARRPATRFVFGLRDIMDDAARIRAAWREMGVYHALETLYDGIAVYGSQRLFDVAEAYAIPPSVHPKLHYCGYIVRDPPRESTRSSCAGSTGCQRAASWSLPRWAAGVTAIPCSRPRARPFSASSASVPMSWRSW